MASLVEQISQDGPPAQSTAVLTTLSRILGNVVANPHNPKFRTLKKTSKAMTECVAQTQAAVSLLLAVGFEDCGDTLECPMDADLEAMSEVVDLVAAVLLSQEDRSAASNPTPTIVGGVIDRKAQTASTAQGQFQRRADGASDESAREGFRASLDVAQQRARAGEGEDQFKRRERPGATDAEQLQRAREARKAQYESGPAADASAFSSAGSGAAAPVPALAAPAAPVPSGAKKKSALDFQSRTERQRSEKEAALNLQEMRQAQKEKHSKALEDPSAFKSEAYSRPPSVAQPARSRRGWCCLSGRQYGD